MRRTPVILFEADEVVLIEHLARHADRIDVADRFRFVRGRRSADRLTEVDRDMRDPQQILCGRDLVSSLSRIDPNGLKMQGLDARSFVPLDDKCICGRCEGRDALITVVAGDDDAVALDHHLRRATCHHHRCHESSG